MNRSSSSCKDNDAPWGRAVPDDRQRQRWESLRSSARSSMRSIGYPDLADDDDSDDELDRLFGPSCPDDKIGRPPSSEKSDSPPSLEHGSDSSDDGSVEIDRLREDYREAVRCLAHCESVITDLRGKLKREERNGRDMRRQLAKKDGAIAELEKKIVDMSLELAHSKAFEDEHRSSGRSSRTSLADLGSVSSSIRCDSAPRLWLSAGIVSTPQLRRCGGSFAAASPRTVARTGPAPHRSTSWFGKNDRNNNHALAKSDTKTTTSKNEGWDETGNPSSLRPPRENMFAKFLQPPPKSGDSNRRREPPSTVNVLADDPPGLAENSLGKSSGGVLSRSTPRLSHRSAASWGHGPRGELNAVAEEPRRTEGERPPGGRRPGRRPAGGASDPSSSALWSSLAPVRGGIAPEDEGDCLDEYLARSVGDLNDLSIREIFMLDSSLGLGDALVD